MKAVLIAAGKGTRLQPLTLTTSKGMLCVANRPILAWLREMLDFCEQIIIVANKNQKDIIDHFANDKKVKIVFQNEQLGTGHALLQAQRYVKGKFLAMYGDDMYGEEDIKSVAKKDAVTLCSFPTDHPELYGILEVEKNFVRSIEEKPDNPKSNLANCGLYILDPSIFPVLKKLKKGPRGEYDLPEAIKELIDKGVKVKNHTVKTWIPVSHPWNLLDANKYLLDKHGSQIHKSAQIRPGAVIEKPVAIGEGAVVGPNCFLRKYSSIGKDCKVGQAVEVKNSIILENSFASHLSYIGDTLIGKNCNIGGGTIFANLRLDDKNVKMEVNGKRTDSGRRKLGGIVGDGVKFGTRVTVMPGKRIWPNMIVPACHTVTEDIKTEMPLSKYQVK